MPQVVIQTNGQMAALMNNSDFKLHLCKCHADACRFSPLAVAKRRRHQHHAPCTMHHAPFTRCPMPDARPAAAPGDAFATKCPKSCEFFANAQFVCVNTFVRTAEQTKGGERQRCTGCINFYQPKYQNGVDSARSQEQLLELRF